MQIRVHHQARLVMTVAVATNISPLQWATHTQGHIMLRDIMISRRPHNHPRRIRQRRRLAAASLALAACATLALAADAGAQMLTKISVAEGGGNANGSSNHAVLSANGRFAAFTSVASNLVAGDDALLDVFVRDLVNNTTERVSLPALDAEARYHESQVAISDDGNIVLFTTNRKLSAEDTNVCSDTTGCADLYAHDRTTHATTLLTHGQAADDSRIITSLSASADGRFAVFVSSSRALVENDTNNTSDAFLIDRLAATITRISVGPNGEQFTGGTFRAALSGDGRVVIFATQERLAGAAPCPEGQICTLLVRKTLATGAIEIPVSNLGAISPFPIALDHAGRTIAYRTGGRNPRSMFQESTVHRYDAVTGQDTSVTADAFQVTGALGESLALSRDGRRLTYTTQRGLALAEIIEYDHQTGLKEQLPTPVGSRSLTYSADGRYLAIMVPSLSNQITEAYRYDRDTDNDGLSNVWETTYGLNPDNASDAALDPDNDGRTNLQEYEAGSHPAATHARHFAEGVSNEFFRTRFALFNPYGTTARVNVRLFGEGGQTRSTAVTLGAHARDAVEFLPGQTPGAAYAAVLESDEPIVADRLTTWDATTYGSSLESSIDAPASNWFFAEGATGNGFSLYYLLSNPGETDASVTVDYLRPSPLAPLSENVAVPAHSRLTLDVASRFEELLTGTVSARLTSTQPIVAERAMYRSTDAQFMAAGHAGAGIVTPAPRWFLAEGATGFFDEYVLVANPGDTDTEVKFTFLPENGPSFDATRQVKANSRFTLDVKEFPALASTAVSIIAESTNATPIVVERAMWWPSGVWYEGSLSAGVTATGTKWAIAEGDASSALMSNYILVANTDPTRDGAATLTFYFQNGQTREGSLNVARNGRATFDVSSIVDAQAYGPFSVIVESVDNLPIVVERAIYHNSGGAPFAAGATSVATPLPSVVP